MTLYIRDPLKGLYPTDLRYDMSLQDLYKQVSKNYIDKISLSFQGEKLPNDSTPIADTGISNESTLDVKEWTLYYATIVIDRRNNFTCYNITDCFKNGTWMVKVDKYGNLSIEFLESGNDKYPYLNITDDKVSYEFTECCVIGMEDRRIHVSRTNRIVLAPKHSTYYKKMELIHLQNRFPSLEFDFGYIYTGDFGDYLMYQWSLVKSRNIYCYLLIAVYLTAIMSINWL